MRYYCPQSALFRKGEIRSFLRETQQSLTQGIFTDAEFYLPRKSLRFTGLIRFLQWGGLAILAVIGNLSPVGWGRNSLVDMFIMICWIIPFLFCSLELLPAMMCLR